MSQLPKLYGPSDIPPPGILISNTAQHAGVLMAINIAFPVIVLQKLGGSVIDEQNYIALALVVLGIGSLLQACRTRWFGSGLLVPTTFTAAYMPGILIAAETGGVPLISGMLLFAAVVEILVGFSIRRLRHFISVEIAGLVILIIGILLGMVGLRLTLGIAAPPGIPSDHAPPWIGFAILAVMVLCAVYAPGRLKSLAALIGLIFGITLSATLGYIGHDDVRALKDLPFFHPPHPLLPIPTFDLSLAPVFALAGLACALRAAGDVTTAQKTASRTWRRPEYGQVSRGIIADGMSTAISGILGSLGPNTFSGSVGLAAAAGVMSRSVCVAIGIVMIVLGMIPAVCGFGLLVPPQIFGPVLMFSAAYIMVNGMAVIASRALNNKRIMVVGLALLAALSRERFLTEFDGLPAFAQTLTQSDLTIAITVALIVKIALSGRRTPVVTERFGVTDRPAALEFARAAAREMGVSADAQFRAEATIDEMFDTLHPTAGADSHILIRYSATEDAVKLSIKIPTALRKPRIEPARFAPALDLHLIDDIDAYIAAIQQHLLRGRADRVAVRDQGDHEILIFEFDQ
ncbi:solute carrier family 23 protein [Acuticoccus kandeliae]|uniref:solute carrier family 23 protein n=1 Tax=Acuticoccus kandeliae TaxID=2073160 RepID=UPI001475A18E|nr:solute carrier family 23 protein [Acuticoccus kandeliae]